MNPVTRAAFGVAAFLVVAGAIYLSFRGDASVAPITEASPTETADVAAAPPPKAASPESAPVLPSYKTDAEIPYDKLTTVAHHENRVIYTTSMFGEPMEVHPDGLVVIYNRRQVLRWGDGREEVRYVTIRARPKLVSADQIHDVGNSTTIQVR